MKRDMDLIRLLLLRSEADEAKPDLATYTEEQIIYHSALLIEAGLVHGRVLNDGHGQLVGTTVIRLTWSGHDFLASAKNDTIWKKAGEKINKAGVQVTFSVLEELLKRLVKDSLGLP